MYIIRFLFATAIICHIALVSIAQDQSAVDSIQSKTMADTQSTLQNEIQDPVPLNDSLIPKKMFSGAEIVIDYGKLLTLWTSFESKFEAGLNFRFYEKIVLAGEFGYAELNPLKAYDNALYYTVKGAYGRIGLDYYTSYDPKNFYYVGIRYAMSDFEDEGAFLIDSDFWEDYEEGFGSTDITASWFEIVAGTETYLKLGKNSEEDAPPSKLLLGWKFRLRFLMDFQQRAEPRIYSIPGFGRTFNQVVPALNFYVKYRIGS